MLTAEEDTPSLSIPDSDDEETQPLASRSTPSQPDYLLDPTLFPSSTPPPSCPFPSLSPFPLPSSSSSSSSSPTPPAHHPLPIPPLTPSVLHPHPYYSTNRHKLACQQPSTALINHNPHISSILERLEEMNAGVGDKWRAYSYRKAVGIVKGWPTRIDTDADLDAVGRVRGIGAKMKEKLREIVRTGRLDKVQHMEADERVQVMERFSKIHGVAGATASKWYAMGLRTLNDVVQSPLVELNASQVLGVRYYEDKLRRIPRREVAAVEGWVRDVGERLLAGVQVICCGSYRRGKPSSGDVDLLITHAEFGVEGEGRRRREDFMHGLMERLNAAITPPFQWRMKGERKEEEGDGVREEELLVVDEQQGGGGQGVVVKDADSPRDAQATPSPPPPPSLPTATPTHASPPASPSASSPASRPIPPCPTCGAAGGVCECPLPPFIMGSLAPFNRLTSQHAQASFMGFCRLPVGHPHYSGIVRRLDIKVYPRPMFPFALLYFTGSDHFNRSMRWYAKKSGWTLSDHGLSPAVRVQGLGKVWVGRTVECQTEKDIFDAMGLTYRPPTQRNVWQHFDMSVEEVKSMQQAIKEEEMQEKQEKEGGGVGEGGIQGGGGMAGGMGGAGGEEWKVKMEESDSDSGAEDGQSAQGGPALHGQSSAGELEPEDLYAAGSVAGTPPE